MQSSILDVYVVPGVVWNRIKMNIRKKEHNFMAVFAKLFSWQDKNSLRNFAIEPLTLKRKQREIVFRLNPSHKKCKICIFINWDIHSFESLCVFSLRIDSFRVFWYNFCIPQTKLISPYSPYTLKQFPCVLRIRAKK